MSEAAAADIIIMCLVLGSVCRENARCPAGSRCSRREQAPRGISDTKTFNDTQVQLPLVVWGLQLSLRSFLTVFLPHPIELMQPGKAGIDSVCVAICACELSSPILPSSFTSKGTGLCNVYVSVAVGGGVVSKGRQ